MAAWIKISLDMELGLGPGIPEMSIFAHNCGFDHWKPTQ